MRRGCELWKIGIHTRDVDRSRGARYTRTQFRMSNNSAARVQVRVDAKKKRVQVRGLTDKDRRSFFDGIYNWTMVQNLFLNTQRKVGCRLVRDGKKKKKGLGRG